MRDPSNIRLSIDLRPGRRSLSFNRAGRASRGGGTCRWRALGRQQFRSLIARHQIETDPKEGRSHVE